MDGLDIALVGVRGGRDADVLGVAKSFGECTFELAAVVGLPDQIAERDAVAVQMLRGAPGRHGSGRGATTFGEGPEEQAAADIASGVLDHGQAELLGWQPVAGDIVEIFGVGADLLKQSPWRFDVRQVLFPLVFAAAFLDQPVLAPDAFQSAVADGQVELADQAARAESGKSFSQLDQLRLDGRGSFQGLVMACAGPGQQAGRTVLLEATQPFAYRGRGSSEQPRPGFDAALASGLR